MPGSQCHSVGQDKDPKRRFYALKHLRKLFTCDWRFGLCWES